MDILQKTKQPLRQISEKILLNASIFIFIVLMQCWSSLIGLSKYPVDKLLINLSIIILQATCITCILSILPETISRVLRKLIVLLASLVFFVEGITLVQNNMLYGYGVLLSITATNAEEGSAYLLGLNYKQIVLQTIIPYIIIVSLTLMIKNKRVSMVFRLKYGVCLIFIVLFTIPGELIRAWKNYTISSNDAQLVSYMSTSFDRFIFNTIGYYKETNRLSQAINLFKSIPTGVIEENGNYPKDLSVIVILGESLNRRYMHCYGYPLENTPHLDSLIKIKEVIAYEDVLSPYANTALSVPSILSFSTLDGHKDWYETASLLTVMQAAGYSTEWISNQESLGRGVQPVSVVAQTAQTVEYTQHSYFGGENNLLDEHLFPIIEKTALSRGRNFRIIHLIGNHVEYKSMFPKSYTKYKASDIKRSLNNEEKQMVADYVNSVYYNDHIVAEIIRRHSNGNTILFYISDHGQAMYDDPKHPNKYNHLLSRHAMEVPLLIYLSPSLKAQMPNLYDDLAKYRKHRIQLDLLPYAITGLLGVQHQYSKAKYNFFSPEYDNTRARTLREHFGATPQETL